MRVLSLPSYSSRSELVLATNGSLSVRFSENRLSGQYWSAARNTRTSDGCSGIPRDTLIPARHSTEECSASICLSQNLLRPLPLVIGIGGLSVRATRVAAPQSSVRASVRPECHRSEYSDAVLSQGCNAARFHR